jgi:UDP-N-acetylmuramyl tripeptide synthase
VTVSTRWSSEPTAAALPARAAAAVEALKLSNWLSRTLGRGSGTVAGGRVGLALDPTLLTTLTAGRRVALVSGTNGKTTTTRMLVAALSDGDDTGVASNATGANMPAGHLAALVASPQATTAVLEVDEGYVGRLVEETHPRVVVLLNLSRDQLDRIAEVRMLVDRWRAALGRLADQPVLGRLADQPVLGRLADQPAGTVVVANADDPMVVWAAQVAPHVRWVGAGQVWHNDAVGCPACGGGIVFAPDGGWACDRCEFARPERGHWLEGTDLVATDGTRLPVAIGLPGQFNRANAVMAAVAAPLMGEYGSPPLTVAAALARLSRVDQVAGRFSSVERHGRPARLLLAKNPAGWTAVFDLLDETRATTSTLVLSVNARIADGLDTSWLWDVPFERLAGRRVVATGDRRRDLAVRLRYAEVECEVVADPLEALDRAVALAAGTGDGAVDFLGNYTAFADLRARL